MDLNTQLRTLRERFMVLQDETHKIIAKAEGEARAMNPEEREKFTAARDEMLDKRQRIDDLERLAGVGAHHPNVADQLGLSPKDAKAYSLRALMLYLSTTNPDKALRDSVGFELECSQAIEKRINKPARGVYVPRELWTMRSRAAHKETRTLLASTGSLGGYLVGEDQQADAFIGALRSSIVAAAGATRLTGLVSDVSIPKQTGAGSHQWLADEASEVTEANQSIGLIRLSPKHGAALTRYSRQMLHQATPAIDRFVTNDLDAVIGLAIDNAALYGTGSGGQPLGVKNQTGVNKPSNFAAAVPTWTELMTMVGECALDNTLGRMFGGKEDGASDAVEPAWLVEGQMLSLLLAKSKDTGSGQMIVDAEGRIGMWRAGASNNITTGDVWFGSWQNLLIATWGDPDVIVNPYTSDASGLVRVVVHHMTDCNSRHPQAFCYNNDG